MELQRGICRRAGRHRREASVANKGAHQPEQDARYAKPPHHVTNLREERMACLRLERIPRGLHVAVGVERRAPRLQTHAMKHAVAVEPMRVPGGLHGWIGPGAHEHAIELLGQLAFDNLALQRPPLLSHGSKVAAKE